MIKIDFVNQTFVCPYCGKEQAFSNSNMDSVLGGYANSYRDRQPFWIKHDVYLYHIQCNNRKCNKIIVIAYSGQIDKQWDLIPENVHKIYPDYIPIQIRDDYTEASSIMEKSPKAAATLLRRCLQGMIHDFWNIHEKNLNAEISQLQGKISATQWQAIDGLRSIGNIGAHMENDVNLIIDIELAEALKLQKLIELLLEKWYIDRYEEEKLYAEIIQTAEQKQDGRIKK